MLVGIACLTLAVAADGLSFAAFTEPAGADVVFTAFAAPPPADCVNGVCPLPRAAVVQTAA
ncbi:MAG: hypothetical protein ACRDD1_13330, partial [Planctomycetia bacterium]